MDLTSRAGLDLRFGNVCVAVRACLRQAGTG